MLATRAHARINIAGHRPTGQQRRQRRQQQHLVAALQRPAQPWLSVAPGRLRLAVQRRQVYAKRGQTSTQTTAAAATWEPRPGPASQHAALRLALEILRPDWPLLLATSVALGGTIFFTLAFPMVIGEVFDVVRAHGGLAGEGAAAAINPFGGLASGTAAAAPTSFTAVIIKLSTCLVLSATGNALVAWCSALVGERFGHRLRRRLMGTIMTRPQPFFDATTNGDLVSRLTLDVTVLQNTLADFIGQRGFRSLFEVAGALLMVALQQPLLALVTFFVTPLLSRLLRAVVVRSSAIIYQRQKVAASALEFAAERLSQVQTVQVFAQEQREAAAFSGLSQSGYELAQQYAFFQGVVEGAGRLAVNVGTVALLGLGGMLVIQNKISVGTLLAANVYNLFISVGLSAVAASLGELGKAVGALERVAELVVPQAQEAKLATPARYDESSSKTAGASSSGASSSSHAGSRVEFRDVWFRYPGSQDWAVQSLNLTLQPGHTVALVGPSGGGKSTIAALLLGLYEPQRGTILVNGQPLAHLTAVGGGPAVSGMAAVLQQPMLMSGSVREQISFGKPGASMSEVVEAARAAFAHEFVQQLPDGFDTEVGERGHALSGGQKQRLAIARALLLHPKVLVLDEVTSALDVASERYISRMLRSLQATKLIIAHRLSTVRSADLIAVVSGGSVVEQGSHEELMQLAGGTYRRLVHTAELGAYWVHPSAAGSGSDEGEGEGSAEQEKVTDVVPV